MNLTTEQLELIILEELDAVLGEKVEKRGDEYVYVDKKGKVRGRHKTKKAAEKQEKAIYISRNVGEGVEQELNEKEGKKDACYHKVKARYDVWPSAYASGALVKCRKVGAKNWGNKSKKKNESLNESEDEFKPHMMYDPKSSKKEKANKVEDHERLAKKGYTHVDPEKIREIIGVGEGGAAGMDPFLKEFGKEMKDEIIKTLEAMPDIGKHKNGDYVMADKKQIKVVKEQKKKSDKDRMKCNSPRRIRRGESGHGKKKFVVKACDGGTEKIIRYGDANMEIKKDSPARRKSFRARHNCDNPGSKLKARYWSCKKW